MSLDVALTVSRFRTARGGGIFVRAGGSIVELTRDEWDDLFPNKEPVVVEQEPYTHEVFWGNITHNLVGMAKAAGIYLYLWRPETYGITKAKELIEPLEDGLKRLKSAPDHFKELNPSNGWGNYEGLVALVEKYLEACREYPDAVVYVGR